MKFPTLLPMGLLPRVVLAIVMGSLLGLVAPLWVARVAATFNALFAALLAFLIPLIIVGLVTPAIATLGRYAGRLLLITVALAYTDTVVSGLLSLGTSLTVFPRLLSPDAAQLVEKAAATVEPLFTFTITPLADVMSALLLALLVGLGVAATGADTLRRCADEFCKIVELAIRRVLVPLLPLYIFCLFALLAFTGQAWQVARTFAAIIGVIFVMHVGLLLVQYCLAGAVARTHPLRALRTMLPAYFTALGTSSSAATIPVTLEQTVRMGVRPDVAGFVVPLCATIHLSGSTMKITACAVALMLMQGVAIDPLLMTGFVMMLGVMMVAAPGVPGGAVMAALGVLQSMLGFDAEQQALMVALYITMDSFGTACNVVGDGAIALVVNRLHNGR